MIHWQCGVLGGESGYEDRKSVAVLGYSIFIVINTKRVGVCEAESAQIIRYSDGMFRER